MEMQHEAQYQRTLVQVIQKHWMDLLHETKITEFVFASSVRDYYEARVAPHARQVQFSDHDDTVTRMKRDAEKIHRWFQEDVSARLPADLVEAMVMAFPADRRFKLQAELAGRQGMLAVPIPVVAHSADGENLGRIGKEYGEAIIAISAMLADGAINKRDRKQAPKAIKEIDEAVAVLMEMRNRIIEQTECTVVNFGSKERSHG